MYVNNKHNAIGASRIRLTFHSKDRSLERLGIESDQQLRTMAASARNKGYNIDALTIRNYEQLGISYEELVSVKRQFRTRTNSERIYLHKGFVWVFADIILFVFINNRIKILHSCLKVEFINSSNVRHI